MFGKLKDKLKSALSIFSKKAEEEAEEVPQEKTVVEEINVVKEVKTEKPIEVKKHVEVKIPSEVKKHITEKKVEEKKEAKEKKPEPKKEVHPEKKKEEKKELPKKEEKKSVPEKSKAEPKKEIIKEKIEIAKEKELIPKDTVKITYFVHGTTTDNQKEISSGWSDVDISELGIKQSIELKKQINIHDFEVVFCSDLKRAVHSAELTFKDQVKIIQDKRLRECDYGKYNGRSSNVVEPLQEDNIIKKFPDGESYEDVKKRIADFLEFLRQNYSGKHIAIVAHKVPQLALDVLLKNRTWEQAFAEDWRKKRAWQPGWNYYLTDKTNLKVEEPQEEKRGFFSSLFHKKEEQKVEEQKKIEEKKEKPTTKKISEEELTEIDLPETYNPATQKYEPDLSKIQEIIPSIEKAEEKIMEEIKEESPAPEEKGFFAKIKQSLTTKTISADKFEELFWELELALLENNVSVEVIEKIKADLKTELVDKPLPRDVESVIEKTLKKTLQEILSVEKIDLLDRIKHQSKKPYVIAFFGINGAGKTTSIAKLTYYLQQQGKTIVLAACDTFRAAAIQQLEEHADKLKVKIIKHDYGSDAAAVAYDAVKYAEKNNIDVVMIDTAGRLHSNTNLMAELEKILRVAKPDLKLFVGESITGNDCIEQARQFNSLVEMDGAILTKADVDEKGGAPLSIAYTIKKPILFLGMGQEYKDLEEFSAEKIMERLGL